MNQGVLLQNLVAEVYIAGGDRIVIRNYKFRITGVADR